MKRNKNSLHYIIQVALIVLSAAALFLLRQQLIRAVEFRKAEVFADIIMMMFIICSVLLLCIRVFYHKKENGPYFTEDEENLVKLRHQARVDALTGLLNREEATERIINFLKLSGHSGSHTLFMIDLDNFKSVNDTFGHIEGDKVLKILAAKIRTVFRFDDIVGRLGGDEFIVLMKNSPTADIVRRKAAELLSALEYLTSGEDISVTVTGSIGISSYNGDGKDFQTLYREADEALYRAKLAGKNRFAHFDIDEVAGQADVLKQKALKESSTSIQLKALIDNIDGGIALVEVGDAVRTIYLSRSCVRLLKLSYEGIKQADNKILNFINEEDAGPVEETLRRGAVSDASVEAVFRRAPDDGRVIWVHMRAVHIPFENSDKPVLIAILTDVTNLKETERNYEAQKRQLETVLKVSNIVTFEVDIYKHTLIVTDATVQKYGINTHVIENMPESLIDIGAIHPDSVEECRRMYDEIFSGVEKGSAIIRTMKTNGQYSIERFTYFTVFDDQGRPVKAVGITEELGSMRNIFMRAEVLAKQFRYYSYKTLMTVKATLSSDSVISLKKGGPYADVWEDQKTYSGVLDNLLAYAVSAEDRDCLKEALSADGLRRYFEQGHDVVCLDFEARGQDGMRRYITISGIMFVDNMDDQLNVFIRMRDNTAIKQLEKLTGVRLDLTPKLMCFPFEKLRMVTDALARLKGGGKKFAVIVISIANFDTMKIQCGQKLMNLILTGFIGKSKIILQPDNIVSYNGDGSVSGLIHEIESDERLLQLVEETIGTLKKPAYFHFIEEDILDYRCGISIWNGQTGGFDEMFGEAQQALRRISESEDAYIGIYGQTGSRD